MTKKSTLRIVFTGLFAALVCVSIILFHIPAGKGYIHLGDAFIYLGATILPFPYSILAGSIGGALADLLSGYAIYVIPTFIVKGLNSFCFYFAAKNRIKIISAKIVIAAVASSAVTIIGYYVVSLILYRDFGAALSTIPENAIQAGGSFVVFILLGLAFDAAGITKRVKL